MNIFRKTISLVALMCLVAVAAVAQGAACGAQTRFTADTLYVEFALSEPAGSGSNYAVWAMPRICSAKGDTLTLRPAVFRGRRNMHYVSRERHFAQSPASRQSRRLSSSPRSWVQPSEGEVLLGDTVRYRVAIARSEQPWMWQQPIALGVKREKDGCCSVEALAGQTLAQTRYVPPFVPQFALVEDNTGKAGELQRTNPVLHHISEYRPYTRDRILRKESGALYVHFDLDRSTLRHDFRDNAAVLDRIVDITRQIMADTTSSVKTIQIVGLASVEGPARHNEQLAAARGDALKRYIQQHVKTADALYDVANGGEAWTELRSQIEDSEFDGRDELLRIIDTTPDPALRERRIKALDGGRPYAWVREKLLSDQRNSGYLRIFYDYVPDTAARTINRATELIGDGKYGDALALLRTVSSDRRAQNALGVALYMTGAKAEAIECFRRAAKDGNREAKDNLRQWEKIEECLGQAQ